MSEIIEELKNWLDKVYDENVHIACLELPILKILLQYEKFVSRDEIIKQLLKYGSFERGALSFDHLWSQRFAKGYEAKILNELIEHDGIKSGDKKTKYKIKDNNKKELEQLINRYDTDITTLIDKRLDYVSKSQNNLEDNFINWMKGEKNLSINTCRNYNNRLKNKGSVRIKG